MSTVKVRLEGVDSLERKLNSFAEISAGRAVGKGIAFVQAAAKGSCPTHDGQLRASIFTSVQEQQGSTEGICYTNKQYAPYVEFGTGPRGQASHDGTSPETAVSYTQTPWWIHESQLDANVAEHYNWFYIDTPDGRFYQCSGQAAQPFLYPALKNNEDKVKDIIRDELKKEIERFVK